MPGVKSVGIVFASAAIVGGIVAAIVLPKPAWPQSVDVSGLLSQFDKSASRKIVTVNGSPVPSAIPYASPSDQPLYGLGVNGLKPLYVENLPSDRQKACFVDNFAPEFCLASNRNQPYEGWTPAFVVFPVNAAEVQAAVKFAKEQKVCISVAGTGHDFLNRHTSGDNCLFIRTALMKDMEFDLTDAKGLGNAAGNVKLGPGLVFGEIHKAVNEKGRAVSSGWATTVGIIGWSIGGGHGPFAPAFGLGADNILEVEVVNAEGELVVANANTNRDLWLAVRGGGGSTWGVIVSITIKLHPLPAGGFTMINKVYSGDMCSTEGVARLTQLLDTYTAVAPSFESSLGGLTFITPTATPGAACGATWSWLFHYAFQGAKDDDRLVAMIKQWDDSAPKADGQQVLSYKTWWECLEAQAIEYIIPVDMSAAGKLNGVPSALIKREKVQDGSLSKVLSAKILECKSDSTKCKRQELYHCITGNGSPQDPDVSISEAFRVSMVHLVVGGVTQSSMNDYEAISEGRYFSESGYNVKDWAVNYWGSHYPALQATKAKYDPRGVFGCHHCVQLPTEESKASPLSPY